MSEQPDLKDSKFSFKAIQSLKFHANLPPHLTAALISLLMAFAILFILHKLGIIDLGFNNLFQLGQS